MRLCPSGRVHFQNPVTNNGVSIRMFVEPESVEPKGTIKADPTATARSVIRRQRTVRHSPSARNNQQNGRHQSPRRPHSRRRAGSPSLDRSTLLEDIRRRGRDSVPQTTHTLRRSGHQNVDLAAVQRSQLDGHMIHNVGGQATHRSRVEVEAMQEARNRARSESLRHEQRASRQDTRLDGNRRQPTQGRSPAPHSESNMVYGANISPEPGDGRSSRPSARRAAFTPGFAPAHRLSPIDSDLAYSQRVVDIAGLSTQIRHLQSLPQDRTDASELSAMLWELNAMMARTSTDLSSEYLGDETEWIDVMRGEVESIRCRSAVISGQSGRGGNTVYGEATVRRLSDRFETLRSRRDDSDGLGDRQQSLSPEPVSWETMLTTITPDDQVPSTHSSFSSTDVSASAETSFAEPPSTAPSTAQDAEPCPVAEPGESASESEDREWGDEALRHLSESPDSDESLSQVHGHIHRIESLSRRLRNQRSQGEFIARHRRIVEREAELQRLEMTLQRLERQLDDEREIGRNNWQRPNGSRAGRGRL